MKIFLKFPILFFFLITFLFFNPFFLQGKLPIPSDTIVGLYFPFRDFYAKDYPRGIPFKNFLITDPVRQQIPWKSLSINSLKKVELPLWNPYNFAGTPLLANFQSGVFYPLNIIFFLLPFSLAWSIFIYLQPLLALTFMYLYLRNLKLSYYSGVLGAISFAFCGFFVSWMEWGNVVNTGLWLPLILMATDKIFKRVSVKWTLIFIFSLISSFFAGHLQLFFYLYVVSFLYFIARWFKFRKNKKFLFIYLIINFCFLILTAIQWMPTLQFILSSARNLDQDWHNPGWFIPFQNLTQFIAPDFFGNPTTLNYWGIWNYGEFIGYVGIAPLVLALYAAIFYKRKIIWFFLSIFILSLVFAFPTVFAKVPFKFDFPFLSTSQPTRLIFLADFALCVLAAFGLEYFLKNKKRIFVPIGIIGVLIASFWGFVFFNQQLPINLHTDSANLLVTQSNIKLPTFLFIASAFIYIFYLFFEKKIKYAKHLFIILVLLITIFDLYRFTAKYITFANSNYLFPETKILSYLQKQEGVFRVMSLDSRIFPPNFSIMYKIQTLDGYDPLFLMRYAEFSAAMARAKPDISTPFGFNRIITIGTYDNTLIDFLNIKYVLSLEEIKKNNFKEILREGETILYENTNVIPRAFFVQNTIRADDKYDSIGKVFENKDALKRVAIVEDKNFAKEDKWKVEEARVTIKSYETNSVVIETSNKGEGFLVLADSYYPSWKVKICTTSGDNCQEAKIYLTNYNFRGIVVPPGNHSIKFYNSLL